MIGLKLSGIVNNPIGERADPTPKEDPAFGRIRKAHGCRRAFDKKLITGVLTVTVFICPSVSIVSATVDLSTNLLARGTGPFWQAASRLRTPS